MGYRAGGATFSEQGRRYALGRGRSFYGLWATGTSRPVLVERFPATDEGWERAWRRFRDLEARPPEAVATPTATGQATLLLPAGATLLLLGVALGIGGLFPTYLGGTALSSEGFELLPHACYLAGWTATALCLLEGGRRARIGDHRPGMPATLGALFGGALSLLTFGLYLADLGLVTGGPGGTAGAGLVLSLLSWLLCAGGCAVGLAGSRSLGALGGPLRRLHPVALLGTLVAIGTAAAFAPSWDRYRLVASATGQRETVTAGNAFSNPGLAVAGDVLFMVLLVALVAAALAWRPPRMAAALLGGAVLALLAQLFSAVVQVATPPAPGAFGIGAGAAARAGLEISSGLTVWFFLYCAGVGLLLLVAALLPTPVSRRLQPG